ncbi:hypothetical protein ACFQ0B_48440 [Nonomuraea thailandensis]
MDTDYAPALAVPFGLVSLTLVVRGFRLGVVCRPATVTVRGYLRSRTIPIKDVIDFPEVLLLSIRWRDRKGRRRKTPIVAFSTLGSELAFVSREAARCAKELKRWVHRHQGPGHPRP